MFLYRQSSFHQVERPRPRHSSPELVSKVGVNGFIWGMGGSSHDLLCWNEGFPSGVDSGQPPHPSGLSLPKFVACSASDSVLKSFLFTLQSHVRRSSSRVLQVCGSMAPWVGGSHLASFKWAASRTSCTSQFSSPAHGSWWRACSGLPVR